MTKQQQPRQHQTQWTEEQVTGLVELVIECKGNVKAITKKHNKRFGVKRTLKAVDQQYRRLREIFTYAGYKSAWDLMQTNRELFEKSEPQLSKSDKELRDLRVELAELRALLNERTDPATSLVCQ
tara:strand:+ start:1013 stop:1387 length:375 start_codon:yes stop_codon:yes gene_type:complete